MTRITKDGGQREANPETGMVRDTEDGKFRFNEHDATIIELITDELGYDLHIDRSPQLETGYDDYAARVNCAWYKLIHPLLLNRLDALLQRGAKKYGRDNWQRGTYLTRSFNSLIRHALQWYLGDTSEDHLAGVVFNAMALMVTEDNIHRGELDKKFADCGALWWDNLRYHNPQGLVTYKTEEQRIRYAKSLKIDIE